MTSEIATGQVPGVYRYRAGNTLVTALNDGSLVIPFGYLSGITEAEGVALYRQVGRRPPFASSLNAFLLQWPGHTVLVDTGAGPNMGAGAGRLPAAMQAAGVSPAAVDAILLTHLHLDHFGGMLNPGGGPAFPGAEVLIPRAEYDFWSSEANAAAAPEASRGTFDGVRTTLAAYGARVHPFAAGTAPLPGIEAVPLPGHTAGHTGYFVGDGDARMLIWGDIYHVPDIQSRQPDVVIAFDADPAQAKATRRAIQSRAAAEGFVVAGMHMHFPSVSRITAAGDGYAVLPLPWQADL